MTRDAAPTPGTYACSVTGQPCANPRACDTAGCLRALPSAPPPADADQLLGHALDNASAAIAYAERLLGAIRDFLAAEDAVEREARRAEEAGAHTWSTAPTVQRIQAVQKLREVANE